MKIKKIYEDTQLQEEILKTRISEIMSYELELQAVKYTDDLEISPDSIHKASLKIIDYLKQRGLIVALDIEKYNL